MKSQDKKREKEEISFFFGYTTSSPGKPTVRKAWEITPNAIAEALITLGIAYIGHCVSQQQRQETRTTGLRLIEGPKK